MCIQNPDANQTELFTVLLAACDSWCMHMVHSSRNRAEHVVQVLMDTYTDTLLLVFSLHPRFSFVVSGEGVIALQHSLLLS